MDKEVKKILKDGKYLNSEHYGAMEKEEAIKNMIKDSVAEGETDEEKRKWSSDAYDLMRVEFNRTVLGMKKVEAEEALRKEQAYNSKEESDPEEHK